MTLPGIDVSVYQAPSDWSPVGLSFLIARASIGTVQDKEFDAHIAKAKAAGLVTGAYHFNWGQASTTDPTPEEQARFFLSVAGDVDLLFLDVEGLRAFSPSESQRFIAEVHKAGRAIGLYMSQSAFREDGQDFDWIAKWSDTQPTAPDGRWEFWQYSDGSGIDKDRFNGDAAALAAIGGNIMGLTLSLPDPLAVGTIVIPSGVTVLRVADATKHVNLHDLSAAPAYGMTMLSGGAAAGGFVFDQPDGMAYFVRRTDCTFTPAPSGYTQAQIDAAKLAAAEDQYDLDAQSIVASGKLGNPRP